MKNAPTATLESLTDGKRKITYGVVKPGDTDPSDGIVFVRGGDISEGRINIRSLRTIRKEVSDQYERTLLNGGELLVSLVGNPGEVAAAPKKLSGANIARQVGLIDLTDDVCHKYVEWFLRSPQGQAEMGLYVKGAVQKVINLADLKRVRIPLPETMIQRKIASILSAYDDLIENNTRRIEILEEMGRRLYEEWFVYLQFPGHEEVYLKEGELGRIPDGWKQARLRDICDVKSGYAFKSSSFSEEGIHHLVTIKNVQDGSFSPVCTNSLVEIPSNVPAHCFLGPGDMLLSLTGNVGRVCLVHSGEFLLNQRVAKLVEKTTELKAFVYFTFRDIAFRKRLENFASGVAQQNLSPVKTSEIGIHLPPKRLLDSFSKLTQRNLELMANLENKNTNLRAQRDLLLSKLISGEIDVSDLPVSEEASVEVA